MTNEIKTLKKQVEWCLQNIPQTRNSDIHLMIEVWKRFFEVGESILVNELYNLPREDNIKRIRAKFQAERKYLPTSKEVAIKRGMKEEEWRSALGYNPELRQANLV